VQQLEQEMPHVAAECRRLQKAAAELDITAMRDALNAGADVNCDICYRGPSCPVIQHI